MSENKRVDLRLIPSVGDGPLARRGTHHRRHEMRVPHRIVTLKPSRILDVQQLECGNRLRHRLIVAAIEREVEMQRGQRHWRREMVALQPREKLVMPSTKRIQRARLCNLQCCRSGHAARMPAFADQPIHGIVGNDAGTR